MDSHNHKSKVLQNKQVQIWGIAKNKQSQILVMLSQLSVPANLQNNTKKH